MALGVSISMAATQRKSASARTARNINKQTSSLLISIRHEYHQASARPSRRRVACEHQRQNDSGAQVRRMLCENETYQQFDCRRRSLRIGHRRHRRSNGVSGSEQPGVTWRDAPGIISGASFMALGAWHRAPAPLNKRNASKRSWQASGGICQLLGSGSSASSAWQTAPPASGGKTGGARQRTAPGGSKLSAWRHQQWRRWRRRLPKRLPVRG